MNFSVKLFGALLFVISTTSAGFYLSRRMKRRSEFLDCFVTFLGALSTNIRYTQDDICSLITLSVPKKLAGYFAEKSDFRELWDSFMQSVIKEKILCEDDCNLLRDFGSGLGTTDLDGQLSHIELYRSLFTATLNNSTEEYKQKSKLYKILGFSFGAAVGVMLL